MCLIETEKIRSNLMQQESTMHARNQITLPQTTKIFPANSMEMLNFPLNKQSFIGRVFREIKFTSPYTVHFGLAQLHRQPFVRTNLALKISLPLQKSWTAPPQLERQANFPLTILQHFSTWLQPEPLAKCQRQRCPTTRASFWGSWSSWNQVMIPLHRTWVKSGRCEWGANSLASRTSSSTS